MKQLNHFLRINSGEIVSYEIFFKLKVEKQKHYILVEK